MIWPLISTLTYTIPRVANRINIFETRLQLVATILLSPFLLGVGNAKLQVLSIGILFYLFLVRPKTHENADQG